MKNNTRKQLKYINDEFINDLYNVIEVLKINEPTEIMFFISYLYNNNFFNVDNKNIINECLDEEDIYAIDVLTGNSECRHINYILYQILEKKGYFPFNIPAHAAKTRKEANKIKNDTLTNHTTVGLKNQEIILFLDAEHGMSRESFSFDKPYAYSGYYFISNKNQLEKQLFDSNIELKLPKIKIIESRTLIKISLNMNLLNAFRKKYCSQYKKIELLLKRHFTERYSIMNSIDIYKSIVIDEQSKNNQY